jgi:hypothetical protein
MFTRQVHLRIWAASADRRPRRVPLYPWSPTPADLLRAAATHLDTYGWRQGTVIPADTDRQRCAADCLW